ncbi:MAG: HAD-IA family hydrolase [Candidatus Altiarchaeales archaeon]|nr:HAD-IA family hydrolase [Candidatus Altiarchaeales archaeon]MBD3415677.1 HAD-IA family hydrolase [Candidatus Altiarchaeales archaeon]
MAEAVFFDLWNTLIYCPTRSKVEEALKILGLAGKVDYHTAIGEMEDTLFRDGSYDKVSFFRELCERHGLKPSQDRVKEASEIWKSRLEDTGYFPETEDVLSDLKSDHKLGIISNLDWDAADHARKKYLKDYFDVVVMSCDVGAVKPDPRIYEMGVKAVGVDASECYMVGDSPTADVRGSADAGLKGVLVDRRGAHGSQDYPVVGSLSEVRKVIG